RMLVALHLADRDQLVGEAPLLVGRRPALLRLERERVLVLARDSVALGHVLAGLAHRLERELLLEAGVREAPAERRVPDRPVAAREPGLRLSEDERRARHRLDTARHEYVSVPGRNCVAGAEDGRETGRAEPVDGHARDRLG